MANRAAAALVPGEGRVKRQLRAPQVPAPPLGVEPVGVEPAMLSTDPRTFGRQRFASRFQPQVALAVTARHGLAREIHAVGIEAPVRTDRVEGEVTPGDRFLLSRGGLGNVVSDTEIALVIRLLGPGEAVNHLIQVALDRGAPDTVSVAAVAVAAPQST